MVFLIALFVGAVSAFAFEPFALWPLMPLAFAGLCEMIARASTLRRALLIGWGFGVGQFCIGLNWIATAFTFQAAMPAWLGWVAVVLLSFYLAVYPMLAAGLAWKFGRTQRLAQVLALAGAWAICEWLRGTMFTGFAWNPVGVTLVDTPWRSLTRLIGTYGLSFWTVLLGGTLWLLLRRAWLAGAVVAVPLALGLLAPLMLPYGPIGEWRHWTVRIVQPNIGQQDKWRPGFEAEAYRRLENLTLESIPYRRAYPHLIFWPEAAVTDPLEDGRTGAGRFVAAERLRATRALDSDELLLTGGLAFTSRDGKTVDGATNSVFVLGPLGRVLGRYDKAHLVPYGEYLPMRPVLSAIGLSRLAPGDVDFASGPGPRTITLPDGLKIGFQLCYEIIFSGEVADRASRPDVIFNPSNDAWFGRWGPPQHLAQARLRASEENVYVIRSTPTGISALIDPDGAVRNALPWRTAGFIDGTITNWRKPTLFARVGNIIPLSLGFLLLLAAIALARRPRYRQT